MGFTILTITVLRNRTLIAPEFKNLPGEVRNEEIIGNNSQTIEISWKEVSLGNILTKTKEIEKCSIQRCVYFLFKTSRWSYKTLKKLWWSLGNGVN